MWKIVYTNQAVEDAKKIASAGLKSKVLRLIGILEQNQYMTPPRFEKLKGSLAGAYSRRINIKHRLVYQVIEEPKIVKIIRMWTHYQLVSS